MAAQLGSAAPSFLFVVVDYFFWVVVGKRKRAPELRKISVPKFLQWGLSDCLIAQRANPN